MFSQLHRLKKNITLFCLNHFTTAYPLKWEQWVWSQSCCLLNSIVCRYPHLSAIQISLKESRKECSQHQGIHGVSDVWFLPKAPQGTVVSPEYKRQWHHKQATSNCRKQPKLSATSLTPCSLPPKPSTAYPKYPTGIESSTDPCVWNIAYKIGSHRRLFDTELLWVQGEWSQRAPDFPFTYWQHHTKGRFTFGCSDHLSWGGRKSGKNDSVRIRNFCLGECLPVKGITSSKQ